MDQSIPKKGGKTTPISNDMITITIPQVKIEIPIEGLTFDTLESMIFDIIQKIAQIVFCLLDEALSIWACLLVSYLFLINQFYFQGTVDALHHCLSGCQLPVCYVWNQWSLYTFV